jgi:hypothetical protein
VVGDGQRGSSARSDHRSAADERGGGELTIERDHRAVGSCRHAAERQRASSADGLVAGVGKAIPQFLWGAYGRAENVHADRLAHPRDARRTRTANAPTSNRLVTVIVVPAFVIVAAALGSIADFVAPPELV